MRCFLFIVINFIIVLIFVTVTYNCGYLTTDAQFMIDSKDNLTLSLIDPPPRRRGRPSTGSAKTPAQRMREMRARDLRAEYSDMTNTGLVELLAWSVSKSMLSTFDAVSAELRSRIVKSR